MIRSVVYGSKPRNRLDLYLPKSGGDAQADAHGDKRPVVVFVTVRGLCGVRFASFRLFSVHPLARECGGGGSLT